MSEVQSVFYIIRVHVRSPVRLLDYTVPCQKSSPSFRLPDMFTLDDEEDGQRAKMPCGHAISTTLLVLWVFNAIFNNSSVISQ
jgi:hypothetical protein